MLEGSRFEKKIKDALLSNRPEVGQKETKP